MQLPPFPDIERTALPNVCDWHKLLIFSNLIIIDSSGRVVCCTMLMATTHIFR